MKKIVNDGLSGNIPMALSVASVMKTHDWIMAGKLINRTGKGGTPSEIEEREKKTNV